MKIIIEKDALNWFKEEMDVKSGEAVRFFIRYGGCSTVQKGFSLGLSKEEFKEDSISTVEDGITFFIAQEDEWYFKEHDLRVDLDPKLEEIQFHYQKD
ncbi:MAG: HesB/YadR/YfhF family protein [Bacillaceae bacterium]